MNQNNSDLKLKKQLAIAEDSPIELLTQLSQDRDLTVRQAVASNPNTSVELLEQLAGDFYSSFCGSEIIQNPNIQSSILEKLASHSFDCLNSQILNHPLSSAYAIAIVQFKEKKINPEIYLGNY